MSKQRNKKQRVDEKPLAAAALLEYLDLPAFALNLRGDVIVWNKACEQLTGLKSADVIGTKDHWRGFYLEQRPCLADLVLGDEKNVSELYTAKTDRRDGKTSLSAENWCAMPLAGGLRYLAIDAFVISSQTGDTLAVVETLRDMTALKQSESSVERQGRLLVAALSNIAQGLVMFNRDGQVVVSNNKFADIYDLPRSIIKPGVALQELPILRLASGVEAPIFAATAANRGKFTNDILELSNGKIVSICRRDMGPEGWVSTHEDITERRQAELKVEYLAKRDPLTGLCNRSDFADELSRALARVPRGNQCALLYIDLDHFKTVNDTLGHPTGDALLRLVSDRLRKSVRSTDIVGRLGGDEFAVLQDNIRRPQDAEVLAQRIIDILSSPFEIEGVLVSIGASIGIACAPKNGSDSYNLMRASDFALYRAKSDGRGTYRFFEPEMDAIINGRRQMETDLRQALDSEAIEVYYQPILDIATRQVTCCEALLRWTHPVRGKVPPTDFISIAEGSGLINKIGGFVLGKACCDALQWSDTVKIAVNLSPAQFKNANLVQDVKDALSRSGLPAKRLQLEITENVLLQDAESALAILQELRSLGISISLDDFGTGYSSLGYLRRFPFDKIKIDKSFIQDLPSGNEAWAIIRAIIGLGTNLGMATTAEGVETVEQLERVGGEGCTEVQGWLFSAARPANEIADFIKNSSKIWNSKVVQSAGIEKLVTSHALRVA